MYHPHLFRPLVELMGTCLLVVQRGWSRAAPPPASAKLRRKTQEVVLENMVCKSPWSACTHIVYLRPQCFVIALESSMQYGNWMYHNVSDVINQSTICLLPQNSASSKGVPAAGIAAKVCESARGATDDQLKNAAGQRDRPKFSNPLKMFGNLWEKDCNNLPGFTETSSPVQFMITLYSAVAFFSKTVFSSMVRFCFGP